MRNLNWSGVASVVCLAALQLVHAQAPATEPKFEVASIKPSQSPMEMMRAGRGMGAAGPVFSGQHVQIGTMAVSNMIAAAYRSDVSHLTEPAWTTTTYFSVEAVMPEGTTKDQFPEMIRALLTDRFHLSAHKAMTDLPAYVLTLAKPGTKLKPPAELDKTGCDAWRDDPQFPGAKVCMASEMADGVRNAITIRTDSKMGPQRFTTKREGSVMELYKITVPQFADYLGGAIMAVPNRNQYPIMQVIDKTGLEGQFHISVEREFEDAALSPADGPVQRIPITPDLVANEIMRGLSKEGLKLEKTTAPVEMVVVDRIDQAPTEN
jgi:uncharacterized protein (TIGR03435 family)